MAHTSRLRTSSTTQHVSNGRVVPAEVVRQPSKASPHEPHSRTIRAHKRCRVRLQRQRMVERDSHVEAPFCGDHWQVARILADNRLSTIMVLPRPHCFVAACATPALEIVVHLDGALLPYSTSMTSAG